MIATAVLPDTASLANRTGTNGTGAPVFSLPVPVRGRLDRTARKVRSDEGAVVQASATFVARPDVDGVVYVTGKRLQAGQIVPTEIVASRGYDLIGAAAGKAR